jgi:hypothetical protein
MLPVISALLACGAGLFRSRASLHLEHLALRHQLAVYQHTIHRPRIRPTDRLFWAWLSRLWSDWQSALTFVQPRTVITWQRQRLRDHWRRLSQQERSGRPTIAQDVRNLIRTMWQANPTWGAPRIVGELWSSPMPASTRWMHARASRASGAGRSVGLGREASERAALGLQGHGGIPSWSAELSAIMDREAVHHDAAGGPEGC